MTATEPCRRANANRRRFLAGALLASLACGVPFVASAKKSDRQEQMAYDASHVDGQQVPNGTISLSGSVRITQGTMLLTGDVAHIQLDGDEQVARVRVDGKKAHIQELDENNNLMTGDALHLDYDNTHSIAVLTDDAVVNQQCRGDFHGDKLTYNQNTSVITGQSGGSSLVHGVIQPKTGPNVSAACAKPPTAQAVPNGAPVAGKLPPHAAAKPAAGG